MLLTAFLIPAIAISIQITGNFLPQAGLGGSIDNGGGVFLLEKLDQLQQDLGFASYTEPFVGRWDKINVFLVAFTLMVGTAGLPHVIVRFYTVKSAQAARWSGLWALLFIALLYISAPAVAGFARYYMLSTLNGASEQQLPSWFKNWETTGLILWLDDGDGLVRYSAGEDNEIFRRGALQEAVYTDLVRRHQQWIDTAGASGKDGRVEMRQLGLSGPDQDIIVLATPEMAQLSNWIIAYVAAGGLAAALSTASGLLLVISSSFAHDFYFRIWNPRATERQRLLVGRGVIGIAVVFAGILGIYPPGFVSQVVAFAFGLAASSFFPAIVLGIFSRRISAVPIIAGMLCGIGFTASYIIAVVFFHMPQWTFGFIPGGMNPQGVGAIGMLINFAVSLGLMPFFPKPSSEIRNLVNSIREPEDLVTVPVDIEESMDH